MHQIQPVLGHGTVIWCRNAPDSAGAGAWHRHLVQKCTRFGRCGCMAPSSGAKMHQIQSDLTVPNPHACQRRMRLRPQALPAPARIGAIRFSRGRMRLSVQLPFSRSSAAPHSLPIACGLPSDRQPLAAPGLAADQVQCPTSCSSRAAPDQPPTLPGQSPIKYNLRPTADRLTGPHLPPARAGHPPRPARTCRQPAPAIRHARPGFTSRIPRSAG